MWYRIRLLIIILHPAFDNNESLPFMSDVAISSSNPIKMREIFVWLWAYPVFLGGKRSLPRRPSRNQGCHAYGRPEPVAVLAGIPYHGTYPHPYVRPYKKCLSSHFNLGCMVATYGTYCSTGTDSTGSVRSTAGEYRYVIAFIERGGPARVRSRTVRTLLRTVPYRT